MITEGLTTLKNVEGLGFAESLITCCCPFVTFGQIAEIVDKGTTSCAASATIFGLIHHFSGCAGCLYSYFYRSKLRNQYALVESPCPDCCVHCSCLCCALCQEYRELKKQGFDMSIGMEHFTSLSLSHAHHTCTNIRRI
ncbi:hypothetical protein RHMOL_Rhmol09G0023700 [Rhododendron molle]|uniref:Uncharacterized protein n=1 Tax=Rhododendron molle TaxID=49168 RepID=A0ACC0MA48_RHOML|nr:hypothetical protein RHMOL_Rhmol09G0023700 [Rhododendron molle]